MTTMKRRLTARLTTDDREPMAEKPGRLEAAGLHAVGSGWLESWMRCRDCRTMFRAVIAKPDGRTAPRAVQRARHRGVPVVPPGLDAVEVGARSMIGVLGCSSVAA
jgi:hypothetical protein